MLTALGNGNAVLFKDNDRVFTFSMHCKDNYFSKVEVSDIDVELPSGCSDETYLSTLSYWLPILWDGVKPDLVFYQAGVDILQSDRLGKLNVTNDGCSRRNRIVYDFLRRHGIKGVVTMGGGYPRNLDLSHSDFQNVVNAHIDVYKDSVAVLL